MTHKDVLRAFSEELCVPFPSILKWYPNGRDSVRVTLKNGPFDGEYVFSYEGEGCWIFETMDHYIKRVKEHKL